MLTERAQRAEGGVNHRQESISEEQQNGQLTVDSRV